MYPENWKGRLENILEAINNSANLKASRATLFGVK